MDYNYLFLNFVLKKVKLELTEIFLGEFIPFNISIKKTVLKNLPFKVLLLILTSIISHDTFIYFHTPTSHFYVCILFI